MSESKVVVTPENEVVAPVKKDFWSTYSKPIIYVGSAVIVAIAGWFIYQNYVKLPKEQKANEAIFPAEAIFDKMAQTGFNKDSVSFVLNGGNVEGKTVTGLLKLMNTYSGTDAANRAAYMTGASYLQIKEFDKAIKYLKEFDGNGASQVESKADIMIGHAYAEQKKTDDALSYYKKAATVNEKDEVITPDALLLAGNYAEEIGKTQDAIDLFKKLKEKYPLHSAVSNGEVDKNLARLGVVE